MRWARTIGWFAASLNMGLRWTWCDWFGHGDQYPEWVFYLDNSDYRGFFMRCRRCYRFTREGRE